MEPCNGGVWTMEDLDLLASDLDSSLTGLSGPQNSTFDMSDTLSAIQVIQLNNETDDFHRPGQHCLTFSGSVFRCLNKEKAKSAQDLSLHNFSSSTYSFSRQETHKITKKPCRHTHDDSYLEEIRGSQETDFVESATLNSLPGLLQAPILSTSFPNYSLGTRSEIKNTQAEFQYILAAATALGSKVGDETLTYLNQGQSYEIRLKKLHGLSEMRGKLLKSILRVVFHDRRLQFREKLEIIAWQNQRPSERILDIDLSLSYGIFDVIPDPKNINCCEFMWDPTREASVFLKVNCISTEFTCKRRGGEKGVPFRILIETYSHWENPPCKLDSTSCLVKVFKSKGADRKHKTDREKYEKLPQAEQRDLQPSYQVTLFTSSSTKESNKSFQDYPDNLSPSSINSNSQDIKPESPVISATEVTTSTPSITSNSQQSVDIRESLDDVFSPNPDTNSLPTSPSPIEDDYLNASMSSDQASSWLSRKNFTKYLSHFSSYSAKELLCLSREDLIEICGAADGIRLYNCFHVREPPPLRKMYISRDKIAFHAVYLHSLKCSELKEELGKTLNLVLGSIGIIYVTGPDGILLIVTDKVLQNMKNESVFICEILKSEENEKYTIILRTYRNIPTYES